MSRHVYTPTVGRAVQHKQSERRAEQRIGQALATCAVKSSAWTHAPEIRSAAVQRSTAARVITRACGPPAREPASRCATAGAANMRRCSRCCAIPRHETKPRRWTNDLSEESTGLVPGDAQLHPQAGGTSLGEGAHELVHVLAGLAKAADDESLHGGSKEIIHYRWVAVSLRIKHQTVARTARRGERARAHLTAGTAASRRALVRAQVRGV